MKRFIILFILIALVTSIMYGCAADSSPGKTDTILDSVPSIQDVPAETDETAPNIQEPAIEETDPVGYPPEGEYTEIILCDERYYLCLKTESGFTENADYYGIYDSVTDSWALEYAKYDTYDMNSLEFNSHGNGVFSYKYSAYYGDMVFLSAELGGSFKTEKVYNYKKVRFFDGKALVLFDFEPLQTYVDGRIASDIKLVWMDTKGNVSDVVVPGFAEDDMFYWSESYLTGEQDADEIFGVAFYNYNTGEPLHYVYVYFYEDGTCTVIDNQDYTTRLREYIGDAPDSSNITVEGQLIRIDNMEGDDGNLYYAEFDKAGNIVTAATPMN